MCNTVSSTLPVEIHLAILDELHDDPCTLSACASLCRTFWLHCRPLIFENVVVPPPGIFADSQQRLARLYELMIHEKYPISHFIRSFQPINLRFDDLNSTIFISVLEELARQRRLKSLDIHWQTVWVPWYTTRYSWEYLVPRLKDALTALLRSDELERWTFDRVDRIPCNVFNGSKIRHLSLGNARPTTGETGIYLSTLASPPPLQSLRANHGFPIVDPDAPMGKKNPFRLKNLEFTCHFRYRFHPLILALLDECKETLEYLGLLQGFHPTNSNFIDFSQFVKLRHLKVVSNGLFPISSITRILRAYSLPSALEKLDIVIDITGQGLPPGIYMTEDVIDGVDILLGWRRDDCVALDETLIHPNLQYIREINMTFLVAYREGYSGFVLDIEGSLHDEIQAFIPTQFPRVLASEHKTVKIEAIHVDTKESIADGVPSDLY
ncbi:hypothetical protein CPC08DRAFT_21692 [Agrocybe pediades]|nr:hypothetical protein CPC08DRAFT_21692 [Agrocybe pediades]